MRTQDNGWDSGKRFQHGFFLASHTHIQIFLILEPGWVPAPFFLKLSSAHVYISLEMEVNRVWGLGNDSHVVSVSMRIRVAKHVILCISDMKLVVGITSVREFYILVRCRVFPVCLISILHEASDLWDKWINFSTGTGLETPKLGPRNASRIRRFETNRYKPFSDTVSSTGTRHLISFLTCGTCMLQGSICHMVLLHPKRDIHGMCCRDLNPIQHIFPN